MANQKSVRYSVSISYFTNIAVQNVHKVRTCAHEWTSSLSRNVYSKDELAAIIMSNVYYNAKQQQESIYGLSYVNC
jgi:hypothetical protein